MKSVVKENCLLKRHVPDSSSLQLQLEEKEEQIGELMRELQDTHEGFRRIIQLSATETGCNSGNKEELKQLKECLDKKETEINDLRGDLSITKQKLFKPECTKCEQKTSTQRSKTN